MILALLLACQTQPVPKISLTVSQFAAQYGAVRSIEEAEETPATAGLRAAVADLKSLESSFPTKIRTRSGEVLEAAKIGQSRINSLYWATLDALTYSAGSADRLNDIAGVMPKIGGELDTTAAMKAIAKALVDSTSDFDAILWPSEQAQAQACIDSFEKVPKAERDGALKSILQTASITKSPRQINLLVVPRMAGKEGMTVRTPRGLLIIVGGGKYRGTDFVELVFHESAHVLDAAAGVDSLFGKLRQALKAAGRSAFEQEEAPHVLIFLIGAEAVRRNVDPNHKDTGDTFGIYARGLEPIVKVERPILEKLTARQIDTDEAVRDIVDGLAK